MIHDLRKEIQAQEQAIINKKSAIADDAKDTKARTISKLASPWGLGGVFLLGMALPFIMSKKSNEKSKLITNRLTQLISTGTLLLSAYRTINEVMQLTGSSPSHSSQQIHFKNKRRKKSKS